MSFYCVRVCVCVCIKCCFYLQNISFIMPRNLLLSKSPDINECASLPCQNDGTCSDLVNGYTCACAVGCTGINCETGNVYLRLLITLFTDDKVISII